MLLDSSVGLLRHGNRAIDETEKPAEMIVRQQPEVADLLVAVGMLEAGNNETSDHFQGHEALFKQLQHGTLVCISLFQQGGPVIYLLHIYTPQKMEDLGRDRLKVHTRSLQSRGGQFFDYLEDDDEGPRQLQGVRPGLCG